MVDRNGKSQLQVWVPTVVADKFKARSRERDGSVSRALARLIAEEIGDLTAVAPRGVGQGEQVRVRLKPDERKRLADAAAARQVTPANWLRSLALVHLASRPQWNPDQVEALRDIARELRPIGNNINQLARAANIAVREGEVPTLDAQSIEASANVVRNEMRRLIAVLDGDFEYWGNPYSDRLTPARGALKRQKAKEAAAERARRFKPRARPKRFRDDT